MSEIERKKSRLVKKCWPFSSPFFVALTPSFIRLWERDRGRMGRAGPGSGGRRGH